MKLLASYNFLKLHVRYRIINLIFFSFDFSDKFADRSFYWIGGVTDWRVVLLSAAIFDDRYYDDRRSDR
jgi:hypothetical protein